MTPEQARHETLAAAVEAAAGERRLVRGAAAHRRPPDRGAADRGASAVPRAAGPGRPAGVRLRARARAQGLAESPGPRRRGGAGLRRGRTGRLFLEPWPRVRVAASRLGHGCAVAVEFWEEGPDGDLHSARPAAYTTMVPRGAETVRPASTTSRCATLPLMVEPTAYEFTVPGRRRLHLGRRQRPGVERRARAAAGRGHRPDDAHPRLERPGPVRRPRRAALLDAQRAPARALGAAHPPGHRRAGAALARRRPPA